MGRLVGASLLAFLLGIAPRSVGAHAVSIRAGVPTLAAETQRAGQYVYFPQTLRWVGDGSDTGQALLMSYFAV